MSWVGVPTDLMDRPEWRALSDDAQKLFMAGRLQAGAVESDGYLEDDVVPLLLYRARVAAAPESLFAELTTNDWWERVDGGWLDVHFLEVNASYEKRQKRRAATLKRTRDWQARQRARRAGGDLEPDVDAVKTRPLTRQNAAVNAVKRADLTLHRDRDRGTGRGTNSLPVLKHLVHSLDENTARNAHKAAIADVAKARKPV